LLLLLIHDKEYGISVKKSVKNIYESTGQNDLLKLLPLLPEGDTSMFIETVKENVSKSKEPPYDFLSSGSLTNQSCLADSSSFNLLCWKFERALFPAPNDYFQIQTVADEVYDYLKKVTNS
jgi:hypothetical protein